MLNCIKSFPTTAYFNVLDYFPLIFRSNPPNVFCKKGVLKHFSKFTGKHLSWILFFNKVAGLRPATLLKKKIPHRYFLVNFEKFLRAPFL